MAPSPHRSSARPRVLGRVATLLCAGSWLFAGCGPAQDEASASSSGPPLPSEPHPATGGTGLVILPDENAAATVEPGGIPYRPYYHDFGRVREGEVVERVFQLENTDPVPVAIHRLKPACGCVVPSVRYREEDGTVVEGRRQSLLGPDEDLLVVPPGRIAEVTIRIETEKAATKNAHKTLTTTVTTDSINTRYLQLETHIFVWKPFDLVPNGIAFGRVPVSGELAKSCQIVQSVGSGHEVVELVSVPEGIEATLERDAGFQRKLWRVRARILPGVATTLGRWTDTLVLSTIDENGEPSEPLELGLQADIVPDIVSAPARLVFVSRDEGSGGDVEIRSLLPGHRFAVTSVEIADAQHAELFEARFEPANGVERASAWTVQLRPRSGEAARSVQEALRGELIVALDDAQYPEQRVIYVVHPAPGG